MILYDRFYFIGFSYIKLKSTNNNVIRNVMDRSPTVSHDHLYEVQIVHGKF